MPSSSILYDTAHELLLHINTYFVAQGVDLPDRRYVTLGEPAHDLGPEAGTDCAGQVTVSMDFIGSGLPGAETSDSNQTRGCTITDFVSYTIELVRCVPTLENDGTPPSLTDLDDSALDLSIDGYLLRRSIHNAWSSGVFCNCQDIAIGRLEVISPRGGVAGWRQTLQVDLLCGAQGS